MTIEESGMIFGDFPQELLFHVEKSPIYTKQLKGKNVRTTEFWLLRDDTLLMVEAKTSIANYAEKSIEAEKSLRRERSQQEIIEKFLHSVMLYFGMQANTIPNILPDTFKQQFQAQNIKFTFYVIVKDNYQASMIGLQKILRDKLVNPLRVLWGVQSQVKVIGEEEARKKPHNLVLPPAPTT